jgi:hypothetical protein
LREGDGELALDAKTPFLVVKHYAMGGIWGYVLEGRYGISADHCPRNQIAGRLAGGRRRARVAP